MYNFYADFTTPVYGQNLHNYLILARSCDVIEHVTIWYPYTISYRCSIVTKSVSPAVFEIMGPKHMGSWPWPFNRSRDDSIPHMWFPISAPLEPSLYLQAFSRYSAPKCLSSANRHCACAISRDLYPLCKIWVHILISHPTLPIHYDTFSGIRWRIRGVYSWDPQC